MIDDDERLAEMVCDYLGEHRFELIHRSDAQSGMNYLENHQCDLLLLDVMLPDLDGFEVCRRVRGRSNLPIIMLTARGEETDRVVGLELGADDYLPKPFGLRELLARIRALLRRHGSVKQANMNQDVLRFGQLEIDGNARVARINDKICDLTSYQFDLLRLLAASAGRVFSRDQLMEDLRGEAYSSFDRSIDVHISRIRGAIEEDPRNPKRILTLRGAGYMFVRDSQEKASS